MQDRHEATPRGWFTLPPGLSYCGVCGAPRGETVVDRDGSGPRLVRSTCWCEGPRCRRCGDVRTRRPISDYYDPDKRGWWHVPHFVGFRTECAACRDEKEAS